MLEKYTCPHCGEHCTVDTETDRDTTYFFRREHGFSPRATTKALDIRENPVFSITVTNCLNSECGLPSVKCDVYEIESEMVDMEGLLYPLYSAKDYSKYLAAHINADYREACAIVRLSPKASATPIPPLFAEYD